MVSVNDIIVRVLRANPAHAVYVHKFLDCRKDPYRLEREIKDYCRTCLGSLHPLNSFQRAVLEEMLSKVCWSEVVMQLKQPTERMLAPEQIVEAKPAEPKHSRTQENKINKIIYL